METKARGLSTRRITLWGGGFIVFLIAGLLYLAYGYMPAEAIGRPAYLAKIADQGLNGYVDAGDFRLHYLHQGSGEPVILLPGGGAWIYDMRDLITALAPHYSVYAVDAPGNGFTTPLSNHPDYERIYTLEAIDRSLLAFMDHLGIDKAALVGNSWGGGYALYFAEKHPERISKLVSLAGTGLNLPGSFSWRLVKVPVLGEVVIKLTATPGYVEKTLEKFFVSRPVDGDTARSYYIPYSYHHNLISQWVLERNLDWSVTEALLENMTIPTLIIWGDQDSVLESDLYLSRWRQLLPEAEVVEIPNAGHLVHNDQPTQVKRIVLDFLNTVDR